MDEKIRLAILFFPAFLFALAFHESSHGLVAHRLGDSTAKSLGRITLNPLPHMDFLGTFLLPLFTLLAPGIALPIGGWGKPVPVDYRNLKNPRKDALWISLAGPTSNFILALICGVLLRGLHGLWPLISSFWAGHSDLVLSGMTTLISLLEISVWINLGLGIFNLIPLHPLDGGKIIEGILPLSWAVSYNKIGRYGILIIFAIFYLGGFRYISYPIRLLASWIIPNF